MDFNINNIKVIFETPVWRSQAQRKITGHEDNNPLPP